MHKDQLKQIDRHFTESCKVTRSSLVKLRRPILEAANLISNTFKNGNKLLICGNGGSAAESQHFSAELVGRYLTERRALPAIALTTDTSTLTAVGNDYSFSDIFWRQVEAYGKPRDILFCISTTGNSANVIAAANKAKSLKLKVISLTGSTGGKLKPLSDVNIIIPNNKIPNIQEVHLVVIHTICELVEPYADPPLLV